MGTNIIDIPERLPQGGGGRRFSHTEQPDEDGVRERSLCCGGWCWLLCKNAFSSWKSSNVPLQVRTPESDLQVGQEEAKVFIRLMVRCCVASWGIY